MHALGYSCTGVPLGEGWTGSIIVAGGSAFQGRLNPFQSFGGGGYGRSFDIHF